ncbi:MAG: HAD family hydrolase [Clostridia bacterium]|nr:HAD family hydrolase [Clostridia bacterium]
MKGDLIIFDKDGTLIDFDAFWVSVSVYAVNDVLKKLNINVDTDKILLSFGVENGITDIDGILCKGTYEQMGNAFFKIAKECGYAGSEKELTTLLVEAYNVNADRGKIKPTCKNIRTVIENLKKGGRKLAVVTTDNAEITYKCLTELGIYDLFDKIFTDDGKTPVKPDPTCIIEYCRDNSINHGDVIVVGDTITDIKFARGIGAVSVCVASSEQNRQRLALCADIVLNDISQVANAIKEGII